MVNHRLATNIPSETFPALGPGSLMHETLTEDSCLLNESKDIPKWGTFLSLDPYPQLIHRVLSPRYLRSKPFGSLLNPFDLIHPLFPSPL